MPMSIARIAKSFPRFAPLVLIFAALIYGPRPGFAQTADSLGEQEQGAQSVSGVSPSSDQASEAQQQPPTLRNLRHFSCRSCRLPGNENPLEWSDTVTERRLPRRT